MKFIIGGANQGKLDYAVKKYKISENEILDETNFDPENKSFRCINHFHLIIKSMLQKGQNPYEAAENIIKETPGAVVIMNEIGNGIVPLEKEEREWREEVGRIGCFLAEKAESVERVVCGIAVRLK